MWIASTLLASASTLSLLLSIFPFTAVGAPASICSVHDASPEPHPKPSCAFQGVLKNAKPLNNFTADTLPYCRNTCLIDPGCPAFSYNSDKKTCIVYSETISRQGPRESESGTYFWSRRCFVITYCPENLLADSGFESDRLSYDNPTVSWYAAASNAAIVSPGYRSNFAGFLSIDVTQQDCGMFQYLQNLPSNATYELTFLYYQELDPPMHSSFLSCIITGSDKGRHRIEFNGPHKLDSEGNPAGQWNNMTCTFKGVPGGNSTFGISLDSGGRKIEFGKVRVDDLFLTVK